jgi:hypothetical protein
MPETPRQEFHRLAGHLGTAADCIKCDETDRRQAAAATRGRRAARVRTAAVQTMTAKHHRYAR